MEVVKLLIIWSVEYVCFTQCINLSVFNMITSSHESKTLTKDMSCECKCKFDGRKCSSNQKWNNHNLWYGCKNPKKIVRKKIYLKS